MTLPQGENILKKHFWKALKKMGFKRLLRQSRLLRKAKG